MMKKTALNLGCAVIMLAAPVAAQDTSAQIGLKRIEILQGWRTESGTHMAAVRFALEDGWKTYWRAPGGGGIPPSFSWDGSENLSSVKFHWPSPKLYVQNGISTLGYKGNFILPIEIKPSVDGAPVSIRSQVDFGLCNDVCIPASATLAAVLINGNSQNQTLIKTALAAGPLSAKDSGIQSVSCKIDPIKDGLNITASITFKNTAPDFDLAVIEFTAPDIWIDQTDLARTENAVTAQAELVSFSDAPFIMDQSKLRVTLIGAAQTIEINSCPSAG